MTFIVHEHVTVDLGGYGEQRLRVFVVNAQRSSDTDINPLPEFNTLLDEVVQQAFTAGRDYEKQRNGNQS